MVIERGPCGNVDLDGVKCAVICAWPKAIHEGNGECVFIVEPTATDPQIEALGRSSAAHWAVCPGRFLGPRSK